MNILGAIKLLPVVKQFLPTTVGSPYLWVPYLQIQTTADGKHLGEKKYNKNNTTKEQYSATTIYVAFT